MSRALSVGSSVFAAASLGILGATAAILSRYPNPGTRLGRHLIAGALANLCLCLLLVLIALFPLRRGEKWAWWACAVPVAIYGLPMAAIDALYAPRDALLVTLLPQVAGLAAACAGLALCATEIWKKS